MCREAGDKNIVCSSYSLYVLLGVLANVTEGETRKEILRILGDEDIDSINEDIMHVSEMLSTDSKIKYSLANGICVKNEMVDYLNEDLSAFVKKAMGVEIFSGNNVLKQINDWVNKNTNGLITSILDRLPVDFVMVLINAIAFEAEWEKEYDNDSISKEVFYNSDKSESEVNMLNSFEDIYYEDDDYTGFIKDYKGGDYAFMALLPKKTGKSMFNKKQNMIDFCRIYANREENANVVVSMPEFELETNVELIKMCEELGIHQLFTKLADFSSFIKDVPVKIDSIKQKTKMKVDREGTKAVTATHATVVYGGCISLNEIKYVTLDRSFVYAIIHKETGLPVFSGIVNKL